MESYFNKNFDQMISNKLLFSECSLKGYRPIMEDRHVICELSLNENFLCTILDGHGGYEVSDYVSKNIVKTFENNINWIEYKNSIDNQQSFSNLIKIALEECFMEIDSNLINYQNIGSCITLVIITPKLIYCANSGDSRTILIKENSIVIPLSEDHKPLNIEERKRIEDDNGYIIYNRVNGRLSVSRAFGDFWCKINNRIDNKTIITAFPDVSIINRNEDDKFLVIGCDGLWDVMSNEKVSDFINSHYLNLNKYRLEYMNDMIIKKRNCKMEIENFKKEEKFTIPIEEMTEIQKLSLINEILVHKCIISKDNVSIIIVKLK